MTGEQRRVYVIVLNWNNYAGTKNCLESLQQTTYSNLKIIVVDNGSIDGSSQQLQTEFPDITFIYNDKNLGFARGVNVGIKHAIAEPCCAYVLLLNNDATLLPNFVREAIVAAESNMSIGVLGGKMYQTPDSTKISYAGGYISRWTGGIVARGLGQEDHGHFDIAEETDFVIGALMLVKRRVLENVGLLPEEYFFGCEDIDYCLAVKKAGFKLYFIPTLSAYHLGGGSHWGWEPKWIYNGYRNKLTLLQKYLPFGFFPIFKFMLFVYARFFASRRWRSLAIAHGFEGNRPYSLDEMQRAMIQAIRDHGKDGPTEETLARFDKTLESKNT
jgi:GT2 family glycosyltransferase